MNWTKLEILTKRRRRWIYETLRIDEYSDSVFLYLRFTIMHFTLREDIVKNRNGTKWNFLDVLCTLREFIHCLLCSDYDLFFSPYLSLACSLGRSSPKCFCTFNAQEKRSQAENVCNVNADDFPLLFIFIQHKIFSDSLSYYCQEAMIKMREKQNANTTIVCDAITFSMVRIKIIVIFFVFFFSSSGRSLDWNLFESAPRSASQPSNACIHFQIYVIGMETCVN